jgi:hypothetical protein
MGYLHISDPDKVHARAVRTVGHLKWEWRVYLPENRRFRLNFLSQGIPEKAIPAQGCSSMSSLPSGEFLLKAVLEKNLQAGWAFSVSFPGSGVSFGIPEENARWIGQSPGWSSNGVPEEVVSLEPGAPLELLRLRVPNNPGKQGGALTIDQSSFPQESAGLLVWIEEVGPR